MIEFRNASKHYDSIAAVQGLNLRINQGDLMVLLGASGSGKSTVLKMINRMAPHDQGQVLWRGQPIEAQNVLQLRRRMGYAIQSVGLFPHWDVQRNIATVPQLLGWSASRIHQRVHELLALMDLPPADFAHRYPHQLSGGQQQRVGVARALAADPDVLLMDEPFGALDPITRASLQLLLKDIHRQSGKTIVLVTHDVDEALLLATRMVLLRHGQLVQQGSPLQLLSQPADAGVLELLGRADLGLKLLSLRKVSAVMQPSNPLEHATSASVLADASLREAVATMAAQHCSSLRVLNASGQPVGWVQAKDLFTGPIAE